MELYAIAQFLLYKWSSLMIIQNRMFSVKNEFLVLATASLDFPCGSAGRESTRNAGNLGSIPGLCSLSVCSGYWYMYIQQSPRFNSHWYGLGPVTPCLLLLPTPMWAKLDCVLSLMPKGGGYPIESPCTEQGREHGIWIPREKWRYSGPKQQKCMPGRWKHQVSHMPAFRLVNTSFPVNPMKKISVN